jgi:predicted regulator of Ras-like GTPase activity (Roadblock/LC7/MglB family)
MSTNTHAQEADRDLLPHLNALVSGHKEVLGALVSTVDGFEVAANVRATASVKKLAAMTSSLLALAEAMSQESEVGHCVDLVIEAGDGMVLMMDVPNEHRKLLLTVLCNKSATLGSVLWAARNTRNEICAEMDRREAKQARTA